MKYTPIEGEIWKPIEGIPHYYVSNMGRVKSETCIIKSIYNKRTGLMQAMTYLNGKAKLLNVQNVVAKHFLPPPPDEGMMARHISTDLCDNRADNLVWGYCGRVKNQSKGINLNQFKVQLPKQPMFRWIIKQKAITGLVIATYINWEQLNKLGYKRQSILACANGRYNNNTYKGYAWEVERIKLNYKKN